MEKRAATSAVWLNSNGHLLPLVTFVRPSTPIVSESGK